MKDTHQLKNASSLKGASQLKGATVTIVYSPDIECESCEAVIGRALKKVTGISGIRAETDRVVITHTADVSPKSIVKIIQERGYRASLDPTLRMPFSERFAEFTNDPKKYAVERTAIRYSISTFILLLAVQLAFLFYLSKSGIVSFSNYALWICYLTLSVVAIGTTVWHLKSYRRNISMMAGMMLGMTLGMQSGLLIGAIVAVTNGFFIGAMTGMIVGVLIGAWAGSACGVMGFMEGMMAGLMGGTMGAMTSYMMWYDHLALFMPFFVIINLIILAGLSYMLFEETVEDKTGVVRVPISYGRYLLFCVLATGLLTALIFLAPKSIFFS